MTVPNDDMERLKQADNILQRIEKIEQRLNAVNRNSVEPVNLSELSPDLGEVRMGRFLATESDGDPTDPEFSGVFMTADPETFGGEPYHLGGVNLGNLQVGFNSDTGKMMFCSGNAYIDIDGISGTDLLKWMIKQTGTNSTYTRTGKLGLELLDGDTVPSWVMSLESPAGDAVTITNGDFSSGDLTGWTKTTETNGAWTGEDFYGFFGKLNISGSPVNCVGVLTGDRVTDITAGLNYLLTFNTRCYKRYLNVNSAWATVTIEIKWYDHASAGSLIRTDTVYTGQPVETVTPSVAMQAPTGALSFAIVATLPSTALANNYQGQFTIDDFAMSEITVNQKLWLADDGTHCTNLVANYEDDLVTQGLDKTTDGASTTLTYYQGNIEVHKKIKLDSILWDLRSAGTFTITIRDWEDNIIATSAQVTVGGVTADAPFDMSDFELLPGFYKVRITRTTNGGFSYNNGTSPGYTDWLHVDKVSTFDTGTVAGYIPMKLVFYREKA